MSWLGMTALSCIAVLYEGEDERHLVHSLVSLLGAHSLLPAAALPGSVLGNNALLSLKQCSCLSCEWIVLLEEGGNSFISLAVGLILGHLSKTPATPVVCAGPTEKEECLLGLESGHKDLTHQ